VKAVTDTRFIQKLQIRNLLSFGPEAEAIELGPMNVLIGPNTSGKSNLLEVIGLLQATSGGGLVVPMRKGGGTREWLWKGADETPVARIEATVRPLRGAIPLEYRLAFTARQERLVVVSETIDEGASGRPEQVPVYVSEPENGIAWHGDVRDGTRSQARSQITGINAAESVLAQLRGPDEYPEITYLGDSFAEITIYRGWNTGTLGPLRRPQQADLPVEHLLGDAGNLFAVLGDFLGRRGLRQAVEDALRKANPDVTQVSVQSVGGPLQLFMHEAGLSSPISAARLSDGMIRYLCLLTILCHPEPPPLVCIEEPELGLHPDMIHHVAELLKEASQRTQLIVTTHSDLLVSAFTDTPEAVVVCERFPDGTRLRRLEPAKLRTWLRKYELGEVWLSGELGGVR
jgi:predicted ATPase